MWSAREFVVLRDPSSPLGLFWPTAQISGGLPCPGVGRLNNDPLRFWCGRAGSPAQFHFGRLAGWQRTSLRSLARPAPHSTPKRRPLGMDGLCRKLKRAGPSDSFPRRPVCRARLHATTWKPSSLAMTTFSFSITTTTIYQHHCKLAGSCLSSLDCPACMLQRTLPPPSKLSFVGVHGSVPSRARG